MRFLSLQHIEKETVCKKVSALLAWPCEQEPVRTQPGSPRVHPRPAPLCLQSQVQTTAPGHPRPGPHLISLAADPLKADGPSPLPAMDMRGAGALPAVHPSFHCPSPFPLCTQPPACTLSRAGSLSLLCLSSMHVTTGACGMMGSQAP